MEKVPFRKSGHIYIIPTSVDVIHTFVRTIPTHVGIIPTLVGIIPTLVGIIPTLQEDVLHFVACVGIFLTKNNRVGIFLTKNNRVGIFPIKFSIKLYSYASYTSVKFLPALYPKIMISFLIWNMFRVQ